jgi:hypothetical protein
MSTLYTINVKNLSPEKQDFYFFQKPAQYIGGSEVYSNSIYSATLMPYESSGSLLTFQFLQQYYAGVQEQARHIVLGQSSGYTSATQRIELTNSESSESTNNTTKMSIEPGLGLSVPTYSEGVQPGAFRILTPIFNPVTNKYNAGLAVHNSNGSIILSNFINAPPHKKIDCQPILIFYVQTGSFQAGQVINFTTSSIGSGICDTTAGVTTFEVVYNSNGTWTTNSVKNYPGLSQLIHRNLLAVEMVNVNIKNEAGTSVISTGVASSNIDDRPLSVNSLSQPDRIHVNTEYQIAQNGGTYQGYICTSKNGNHATFA